MWCTLRHFMPAEGKALTKIMPIRVMLFTASERPCWIAQRNVHHWKKAEWQGTKNWRRISPEKKIQHRRRKNVGKNLHLGNCLKTPRVKIIVLITVISEVFYRPMMLIHCQFGETLRCRLTNIFAKFQLNLST